MHLYVCGWQATKPRTLRVPRQFKRCGRALANAGRADCVARRGRRLVLASSSCSCSWGGDCQKTGSREVSERSQKSKLQSGRDRKWPRNGVVRRVWKSCFTTEATEPSSGVQTRRELISVWAHDFCSSNGQKRCVEYVRFPIHTMMVHECWCIFSYSVTHQLPFPSPSYAYALTPCARIHARTHRQTHTRARTHARSRTHTLFFLCQDDSDQLIRLVSLCVCNFSLHCACYCRVSCLPVTVAWRFFSL